MTQTTRIPNILFIIAFLSDLLTPFLIWKGIVPGQLRWLSHGAIALMIVLVPFRMLAFNRIPAVFWVIVVLSLIGIFTALFSGQGIAPTIWGWWLMFQYPLVCIYAYLEPGWSEGFSKYLMRILMLTLIFEVTIQFGQYLMGEIPGDNLAGSFGDHGTGNLLLFLVLVFCFALGNWIENQRWFTLFLALVFGFSASVLGEMKLFLIIMGVLGIVTFFLFALKIKRLLNLIPYVLVMSILMSVFIPVYDTIIPSAREIPIERYFQDEQLLDKYLNLTNRSPDPMSNYFDLGRNYAVTYGWDQISTDPFSLIFGYGIGARSESKTMGIIGRALTQSSVGITSGTSLLIIMQETGLLGLLILVLFIISVISALFKQIGQQKGMDSNGLRYGLILFTLFWPLWIWYNAAWSLRVPMLIYWTVLGYVLRISGDSRESTYTVSRLETHLNEGTQKA